MGKEAQKQQSSNQTIEKVDKFRFNHSHECTKVLPAGSKTDQLFQLGILDLVDKAFNGTKSAFFIIGGQGSGKTHTLIGSVADPGLCFSFARTAFQMQEKKYDRSRIYLSLFSFQNKFRDLLCHSGFPLEHKSAGSLGAYLPGLSYVECPDMLTYLTLLKTALIVDGKRDTNRDYSQSFSLFNHQQERGVFIIKITIVNVKTFKNEYDQLVQQEIASDTYFIDCESYSSSEKIDTNGVNNAMLSLNNCLRAIYEINAGIRESSYVPYEQSPFTSFFKDFLGGRSSTYVIGTFSPFSEHIEHSMRTMREIQWAFSSKSHGTDMNPSQLTDEVGFLKTLHYESVLIASEVRQMSRRSSDLNEYNEDKHRYSRLLGRLFQRFYFVTKILVAKIESIYSLHEQVEALQKEIQREQCSVLKDHVRSTDIKEFFLIKVVPNMFNLVYQKITKLQGALDKKLKALNTEIAILSQIKRWFKEEMEANAKESGQLKHSHVDAVTNLMKSAQEYTTWMVVNFYKAVCHPLSLSLRHSAVKVTHSFTSSFVRLFHALQMVDFEKFEDISIRQALGIQKKQLDKKKTMQSMKQIQFSSRSIRPQNSMQSDTPSDKDPVNDEYSDECNNSILSSVFGLPSSTTLIQENPKLYGCMFSPVLSPLMQPTHRSSVEEIKLDNNQDIGVTKKTKEISMIPFGNNVVILDSGRYYDEDDPELLYISKQAKQRQKIIENLNENRPQNSTISIQRDGQDVKLKRKFIDRVQCVQRDKANLKTERDEINMESSSIYNTHQESDKSPGSSPKSNLNNSNNNTNSRRLSRNSSKDSSQFDIVIKSPSSQLRQYPSDSLYYQDVTLGSSFNEKLRVNVNLFRNELEIIKNPISIRQIFHADKSVQTQKNGTNVIFPALPGAVPKNKDLNLMPLGIKNASKKYLGVLEKSLLQQKLRKSKMKQNSYDVKNVEPKAKSLLESSIDYLKSSIIQPPSQINSNNTESMHNEQSRSVLAKSMEIEANKQRKPDFIAITKHNKHLSYAIAATDPLKKSVLVASKDIQEEQVTIITEDQCEHEEDEIGDDEQQNEIK